MDKIIGMGNALVDVLAILEDDTLLNEMGLPKGSMQLIDRQTLDKINARFSQMKTYMATGGSAGNTILGLASMGVPTGFIGKTGADEFGVYFRNNLKTNHIEDKTLVSNELPSGIASTFISPDGERTFGTYLGAAATLKAEDLSAEMFEGYTYFYIEGYLVQDHDMILRAIKLAKGEGLQVCLDLASYNIVEGDLEFFKLLITDYVDILFANEEEAKAFTGKSGKEAVDLLAKLCSIVIVKVGSRGSLIRKGTEEVTVAPLCIEQVVDTTGAGDYYAAGFLYGLTSGYSLEKCGKIGSILAGNVIQIVGANLSTDKWEQIKLNISNMLSE